jgi:transcriptional regulator with XRE-family HTH domain
MNSDSRMREFGDALRVHRRAGGLTQVEVAARMTDAGHAWYGSTVSKTETGDRAPSLTEVHALAVILAVDVIDLIDGRQVMRAEQAATHAAGTRMVALLEQVAQIRAERAQELRAAHAAAAVRVDRLNLLRGQLAALDLDDAPPLTTQASRHRPPARPAQRATPAPWWSR